MSVIKDLSHCQGCYIEYTLKRTLPHDGILVSLCITHLLIKAFFKFLSVEIKLSHYMVPASNVCLNNATLKIVILQYKPIFDIAL